MGDEIEEWLSVLQNMICQEFIKIELEYDKSNSPFFEKQIWTRQGGGGGHIRVMHGQVFEKVGVNVSTVHGLLDDKFKKNIPGCFDAEGRFWACGISVVSHMQSPLIPSAHMNTRFIRTSRSWTGGGIDITPTYYYKDDDILLHTTLKNLCDGFDVNYYPNFTKEADSYFYLPHRKEPRGIGGIFYDNLNSGDLRQDFEYSKGVGETFLRLYPQIIRKRMNTPYSKEQKEYQLFKRGRYVEFNLIYDRGIKFGLMTSGNNDAMMIAMPPTVKW